MGSIVHRRYKKEFVKVGNTVSIRKPVKFVVTDGATLVRQNVSEARVDIVINKRKHIAWEFDSEELTLTIENYSERYIKPAMIRLADKVDSDLCNLYKDLFLNQGTAGVIPAAFENLGDVAARMDDMSIPGDSRKLVISPKTNWKLANAFKGILLPSMVEGVVRRGSLGKIAEFDIYRDQNIKAHTSGGGSAYQIDGSDQTGSTLTIDTGSGTKLIGDKITIAGLNAANPINGEDTGNLAQFTVTADMISGATSLSIDPAIVTSGAHKNVVSSPADDAVITLVSSYKANLAFHPNCFALVMVPIAMPDGVAFKSTATGRDISVRIVKDYDIETDKDTIRLDILYGVKTIYPDLGCVMLG